MIMSQPSLDSFFTAGGGRSVSWKNQPIGATVTGVIEAVHPPEQVTDPATKELKFRKDGKAIMQVRIDLQTEFRGFEMCKPPEDPNETDDGRRSLYVGGWMTGAVGDALRKAGRQGSPENGAKLSVTLTERAPNRDNPALNPTNKFSAEYTPPSAAATASFFSEQSNGLSAPAAAVSNPLPSKPESIAQSAWDQMDESTKRAVANTLSTPASDTPPF
jgi:hypothetical protein